MTLNDSREGRALARLFRDFDANLNRLRFAMTAGTPAGSAELTDPVDGEGSDCD